MSSLSCPHNMGTVERTFASSNTIISHDIWSAISSCAEIQNHRQKWVQHPDQKGLGYPLSNASSILHYCCKPHKVWNSICLSILSIMLWGPYWRSKVKFCFASLAIFGQLPASLHGFFSKPSLSTKYRPL